MVATNTEEILLEPIEKALNQRRPYLEADGGNVKILELTEEMVLKLELLGACGSWTQIPRHPEHRRLHTRARRSGSPRLRLLRAGRRPADRRCHLSAERASRGHGGERDVSNLRSPGER